MNPGLPNVLYECNHPVNKHCSQSSKSFFPSGSQTCYLQNVFQCRIQHVQNALYRITPESPVLNLNYIINIKLLSGVGNSNSVQTSSSLDHMNQYEAVILMGKITVIPGQQTNNSSSSAPLPHVHAGETDTQQQVSNPTALIVKKATTDVNPQSYVKRPAHCKTLTLSQ